MTPTSNLYRLSLLLSLVASLLAVASKIIIDLFPLSEGFYSPFFILLLAIAIILRLTASLKKAVVEWWDMWSFFPTLFIFALSMGSAPYFMLVPAFIAISLLVRTFSASN